MNKDDSNIHNVTMVVAKRRLQWMDMAKMERLQKHIRYFDGWRTKVEIGEKEKKIIVVSK